MCARVLFSSSVHDLLYGWFIVVGLDLPTQCRQHVGLLQSASCMTVTGCCGYCLNQRAPITGLASQQQLALRNWNASAIFADMFVVIRFNWEFERVRCPHIKDSTRLREIYELHM